MIGFGLYHYSLDQLVFKQKEWGANYRLILYIQGEIIQYAAGATCQPCGGDARWGNGEIKILIWRTAVISGLCDMLLALLHNSHFSILFLQSTNQFRPGIILSWSYDDVERRRNKDIDTIKSNEQMTTTCMPSVVMPAGLLYTLASSWLTMQ